MWPDRESNPGPQTYESGALPTVLRCPASFPDLSVIFVDKLVSFNIKVYFALDWTTT